MTSAPGCGPHPRPQPGMDGSSVLLPRGAWRSIQLEGRGRASGKGRRRQRRPKSRPLSQMLTQLRAPGPRGTGKALPPTRSLGFLQIHRPGTTLLGCLSLRLGLKEKHREMPRGCQNRVGDSPSEAPGWSGWGAVRGNKCSANGNQASETGQPQRLHSSRENPLLAKRCPNPSKRWH